MTSGNSSFNFSRITNAKKQNKGNPSMKQYCNECFGSNKSDKNPLNVFVSSAEELIKRKPFNL